MATKETNGKHEVKTSPLGVKNGLAEGVEAVDVDTKISKGSPSVTSKVAIDWSGVKAEDLFEMARRTLVINWQRVQRDAGKIPATDTLKVTDFMAGKGRPERVLTPEKILAQAEKMDPKQAEALLDALKKSLAAGKKSK